jgi:hypothetical protein
MTGFISGRFGLPIRLENGAAEVVGVIVLLALLKSQTV